MPTTGILSPTAAHTSRAVPSPPAKIISSAPSSSIICAARRVSAALVHVPVSKSVSHSIPYFVKRPAPISPDGARKSVPRAASANSRSAVSARPAARGFAPSSTARRRVSSPSVPLSATAPPIPATGLTMKPAFIYLVLFRLKVARVFLVVGAPRDRVLRRVVEVVVVDVVYRAVDGRGLHGLRLLVAHARDFR